MASPDNVRSTSSRPPPGLLWLALFVGALASGRAHADPPPPNRSVAVLEFRGGSAAVPDIGRRAATLLRAKTSLQIMDGDDARKQQATIDRQLARCAGAPDCVAGLGRGLGVDEVLLLGVSEFGDVILTLQRIRCDTGAVAARVAEALAPDQNPNEKTVQSYLRRVMPRSDFIRYGTIRIKTNVTGARVVVDGQMRGETPIEPLRVRAPGHYQISIDKSGYEGFRAAVNLQPDADFVVEPRMTLIPDPWYRKWWVIALIGAATVGTATAAYLVLSGDPTEVPAVVVPR